MNAYLCVVDLLSPNKKDIFTVQMLKKQLISKLTPNLFKSLNNGLLEFRFDNPKNNVSAYDNFKKFIMSDNIVITDEYLWDFLQRPGVLFDEGCNIIIINDENIKCPYKEFATNFYNKDRPTFIIFFHNKFWNGLVAWSTKRSTAEHV